MITLLLWELRRRRAALLWWTVGSIILSVSIMFLYPSIRDQANQLNQVINQLPAGLRQLKTGGSGTVNVADPVAFLNSQLFYATLPILWIIMAITRGTTILGRDEQNHTLELLLARPVSRGRLLAGKALALLLEVVIVGLLTGLVIIVCAPLAALHVGTLRLLAATLYTIAFSLSFGVIAFMLQAVGGLGSRVATAMAVLISFGGYLIASLSSMTHWLRDPAKLAPFHYFSPDKILLGQSVAGLDAYLLGVAVIAIGLSYAGFHRRDIA